VRETVMWGIGIVMAVGAAAMMVWGSVDSAPLTVLLVIGIVFIGVGARGRRRS
jgi:hypothetical protein